LKRTFGWIALTAIDIGAIIGGEYPHSLEPQRRVNTEENLCGFTGHMVAEITKRPHELQPSRRVPAD